MEAEVAHLIPVGVAGVGVLKMRLACFSSLQSWAYCKHCVLKLHKNVFSQDFVQIKGFFYHKKNAKEIVSNSMDEKKMEMVFYYQNCSDLKLLKLQNF